ncbi:hypothetical protein SALBM217S_07821 [Streptomyces griseoloalbus]
MPWRAWKKAEIGPLPVPTRVVSWPSTVAWTVRVSTPSWSVVL